MERLEDFLCSVYIGGKKLLHFIGFHFYEHVETAKRETDCGATIVKDTYRCEFCPENYFQIRDTETTVER